MPTWIGLSFQDSVSYSFSFLTYLHDHVMMIIVVVVVFISYVLFIVLFYNSFFKFFSERVILETVWSVIPAFLLIVLVLPSMQILYIIEDVKNPSFTFKIIGHQWYWTFVTPLWNNFYFSIGDHVYTFNEEDCIIENSLYSPRLLGVTRSLCIPVNLTSRLLVTSTDVIHSFAIPSLGLKVDALPGRINQLFVSPLRVGNFFGQCSEICGSNHSFIPICMKIIHETYFLKYQSSTLVNDVLSIPLSDFYKLQF